MSASPIPSLIKQARHEAGLIQEQLGEIAGLSRNSIARYETGAARSSTLALNMLALLLGKPVGRFLGDDGPPVAAPDSADGKG